MSKSGAPLKVLYGESNEQTLTSQGVALQKAGYEVQTPIGRKAVQEALNQAKFDVVVLGATLSRDDRHHLPYMVKKASSETRVLVMHTDGSRHPYVDGNTDTGESIDHLIAKISPAAAKGAAAGAGR